MTLIAILLAIATERYWHPLSSQRLFIPLLGWRDTVLAWSAGMPALDGATGVLVTIMPGVILTALLQYGLAAGSGLLMWLLALGFSLLVLVACVGDQRFGSHVKRYIDAVAAGDFTAAAIYMERISSRQFIADNLRQLNRGFIGLLLTRLNDRVLALLFWFVVLGPLGAVLYRAVAQLQGGVPVSAERDAAALRGAAYQDAVSRLKGIMDWLPARLTALCYAMIGSFTDAFHLWREDPQRPDDDWVSANDRLLVDIGIGALQIQADYRDGEQELDREQACEHVLAVRALSKRTLLAWMAILALLTLAGWLG